jgi:hypothetical protein
MGSVAVRVKEMIDEAFNQAPRALPETGLPQITYRGPQG